MVTSTRKKRERQQREARILEVSREMLLEEGYHGLNMDRIAEQLEYSKGTIYNHFACKEEIIIALAIQTSEKRTELFRRASTFKGRPRERLLAIGTAGQFFVQLYPDHFSVEQIMRLASIREKTSENRRAVMRSCESQCISICAGIVRDGIAQGDLELPTDASPEELVFGLWSMNFGAYAIIGSSNPLIELGIKDPISALFLSFDRFLDGCKFQPLSDQFNYQATQQRIIEEVFSDEYEQITAAAT